MDDVIRRQAAIDALGKRFDDVPMELTTEILQLRRDLRERIPSAQPEIIRCKDCRWGRKVCGNIECFVDINVPPEYHGYEWYCPNGERREE